MATQDVPTHPPWQRNAGLAIAEVVERTGLSRDTLRYYEKAGLIDAVDRSRGGQRRYVSGDLAWLEFLLRLRATGMSIADMQRFAGCAAAVTARSLTVSPCCGSTESGSSGTSRTCTTTWPLSLRRSTSTKACSTSTAERTPCDW